jgi:hypothetical protein
MFNLDRKKAAVCWVFLSFCLSMAVVRLRGKLISEQTNERTKQNCGGFDKESSIFKGALKLSARLHLLESN